MAFKNLQLECITDYPTKISARIRRSDRKYYDLGVKKFVSDPHSFIPLASGVGVDQCISIAQVEINPAEFTDGDYVVYYHDSNNLYGDFPKLFEAISVSIVKGSPNPPTTTDITVRILESKVGNLTLRKLLEDLQKQVSEINAKLIESRS